MHGLQAAGEKLAGSRVGRAWDLGFMISCLGFGGLRFWCLGFRAQDVGFRV